MTISATSQGLRPGVCTSTSRPSTPFDGMMIYETDTNTLAVYDGSAWVSLNPVDRDRNVIINGAMQIAQRATSKASITGSGYNTADRWNLTLGSLGTWTQSIEDDAPTGSGFRKSLKMLCTTADASPGAGDILIVRQHIEGQNIQHFAKGTSSARPVTLSFWVKSNVTGTYIAELEDSDNSRAISASYTVSASGTWEKKTLTFVADTTGGTINNDSGRSLDVNFWLAAGSNFTGGASLATTWTAPGNTRAAGQTNLAFAVNNYWQITGVQLEVGAVATPFEFEDYGTTLTKCERYFETSFRLSQTPGHNSGNFRPIPSTSFGCGGNSYFTLPMRVRKRTASPTLRIFDSSSSRTFSENWWRYIVSCNSGVAVGPNVGIALSNTDELFISGYLQASTGAGVLFDWTVEAEL